MVKHEKNQSVKTEKPQKKKISKNKKDNSKSNFLMTTYQMIENEKDNGIVKWGP